MGRVLSTVSAFALGTGSALAGGLDRTGQPIGALFETGNYAELSFGHTSPSLEGTDVLGNPIANVANDFSTVGLALKMDLNDQLSFAVIFDQPYGADVLYGGDPATTMLGGTMAKASSTSMTALMRYKFNERMSVYAGPRQVSADGEITLSGLAYGPASGYNVQFKDASGWGYVVGAAYEIPDIALRASLTYQSAVDLDFDTTENFFGATGTTQSEAPQSITFDFQTGVAADTLVFGSVRWAEWSAFTLEPTGLGANLAQLDDVTTYTLGVGRKFSDALSGSFSVSYEDGGADDLVSPLAPSNGQLALSLGARYNVNEQVTLSGGIRYTMLGDAQPETGTPDVARASFSGNNAVSVGLRVGFKF